jgi:hypothetical protein
MARQTVSVTGKPITQGKFSRQNLPKGCLFLFFVPFFLIGSILFVAMFVWPLIEYLGARQWIETPCTVTSSEVVRNRSSDGDTYRAEIKFRYRFENQEYEAGRHQINTISTNSRSRAENVVKLYPVGLDTHCFVNPGKPEVAVLSRDLSLDFLFGLFPLLFVGVGLGGMIYSWRYNPESKSGFPSPLMAFRGRRGRTNVPDHANDPSWGSTATEPRFVPGVSGLGDDEDQEEVEDKEEVDKSLPPRLPDGPRELRPSGTPVGMFFFMLFFATFWNGIVSVFVSIAISSMVAGRPEWFLIIFIIPFVLIGIALIVGLVYTLLGIFNPRPTLTLSQSNLSLGDRAEVQWKFDRGTSSLRKLTLTLRGVESAKYRRGTSTYTDTSTFVSIPMVETRSPVEIAEGKAELVIPDRSMHSFEGTNNQITWQLAVHGDVPFWPDVNMDFPIHVHPLPYDDEIEL